MLRSYSSVSVQDRVGGFLLSCLFLTFTGISALPVGTVTKTAR